MPVETTASIRGGTNSAPAAAGDRVGRKRAAAILLALIALAVGSYAAQGPPRPEPADSPAREFSAARAFGHVERIAAEPHPVGSAANARVRDNIVAQLRGLGLEPTIQRATSVRAPNIAQVKNIHARIPGRASTGHVVLVSHYDSMPTGPGAADAGSGVAAILEVARALRAGPAPRNDIDLLFTDAEEPGLLGARAFVDATGLDPSRSVVLNLEAGGTSGPVMMFETVGSDRALIDALARVGDLPGASSMWGSMSELMQATGAANTDLTEFRRAGFAGMNFAFSQGRARYHTAEDAPGNLDPASLQHHGATTLTLARTLGGRDLGDRDLGDRADGDATYFSLPGLLVRYPMRLAAPLALLAAAAFVLTVWYARRRGARLRAVAGVAGSVPILLVVAGGLAWGVWWAALTQLRPGYASLPFGATYRPGWYEGGLVLVAAVVTLGWYLLLRRRVAVHEVALGVWAWLALLAFGTGLLVPGMAYLFTWPVLAGCAGLAVATGFGGDGMVWPRLGSAAAAFPMVALFVPHVDFFFAWGLAYGAFPSIFVVLLAATAMPLVDLLIPRRRAVLPGVAALAALALLAVGLHVDRFDHRHPRQTNLLYALDADQGKAWWASADPVPPPWTARYVRGEPRALAAFPNHWGPSRYRVGPAPTAYLTPPGVTVVQQRREGPSRVVRLRVRFGGAERIDLFADTASHVVTAAAVDGVPLNPNDDGYRAPDDAPWSWGFMIHGAPRQVEVTLTVRGDGPLPLRVVARRPGLPTLPQLTPMPDGHIPWPTPAYLTLVARTYRL